MQKVTIYIDTYHTGTLKHGTGSYTIVLEYIKDNFGEVTREYIEGVRNTTKNRTALYACISAFSRMKRPCEVTVIINSQYIVQSINNGNMQKWINTGKNAKGVNPKNIDLWLQLAGLLSDHSIIFTYEPKNQYTTCMNLEMRRVPIDFIEDGGSKA